MSLTSDYQEDLKKLIVFLSSKIDSNEFVDAWISSYEEFLDEPRLSLGLALLYPEFYRDRSGEKFDRARSTLCPVRGSRSFDDMHRNRCDWHKMTGEPCNWIEGTEYERFVSVAKDHVWPYALGGPTVSQNLALLCTWHNSIVKGADIQYFEHFNGGLDIPKWVEDNLKTISQLIHRNGP